MSPSKMPQLKKIKRRETAVGTLFICALVVAGAYAANLQIFKGSWLSKKAAGQYERSVTITGKRGAIYDANHRVMAVSIATTSIAAHPGQVQDRTKTARALAKALNLKSNTVLKRLKSGKSFVWIKRQASPKEVQQVQQLNLEGIGFIPEHSRFYPNKVLAAQVLGFTGIDGRGLEGVEFYYDKYLSGGQSQMTILKDALGRGFESDSNVSPQFTGKDLVLTIDRTIQYMTEEALAESVERYSGKSGMAIVMAPDTGAILAMAHYPFFNPNTYRAYSRELWRNRAITDPFEPGSTMKIFSMAAALDAGVSNADSIFFCENGAYRIGPNVVHDTKPHGWLSLQQIVKYSSNIGAVKVAETMGSKTLHSYLRNFRFGEKIGIDCPGESMGSLSSYRKWTPIDTGAIAFGQGISATALQVITAAAAIANDGVMMKPYLVKSVLDQQGHPVETFKPTVLGRVVTVQTAQTVKRILKTVITEGGTGVNAALEGYSVGGKTGTAQKIDDTGRYGKNMYVSSFLGFAPADHPKAVVLVIVDEPKEQHYGGIVAAPGFKKIMHGTLSYADTQQHKATEKMTVALEDDIRG